MCIRHSVAENICSPSRIVATPYFYHYTFYHAVTRHCTHEANFAVVIALPPAQNSLCSSVISFSGSSPTQAFMIFTSALRCFASAFTTGFPGGVSGAFSM